MATFPIQTDCAVHESDAFKASSDCAKDILSCIQCVCDALDNEVVYADIEIKQTVKEIFSKRRRAYTFCRKVFDECEDEIYKAAAHALADTGATITAVQAALMYEAVQMRDLYTTYADKAAESADLRSVVVPTEESVDTSQIPEPIHSKPAPVPTPPTATVQATLADGTPAPITVNLYLTVHVHLPAQSMPETEAQEQLPLSGLSSGRGGAESIPLGGAVSFIEQATQFEIPEEVSVTVDEEDI